MRVRFLQPPQWVPPTACESAAITPNPAAAWAPEGLPGASDSDSQGDKPSSEQATETVRSWACDLG